MGWAFNRAKVVDGSMLSDGLAHPPIFLVGNFQSCQFYLYELVQWRVAWDDLSILEETNVSHNEFARTRGKYQFAVCLIVFGLVYLPTRRSQ